MPVEPIAETVYFDQILVDERVQLNRRRSAQKRLQVADKDPSNVDNVVGLALSGGGIRAAAFSLGAIRALSSATDGECEVDGPRRSLFEKVDYISSVSGGSYAACSIAGRIIREGVSRRYLLRMIQGVSSFCRSFELTPSFSIITSRSSSIGCTG